MTCSAFVRLVCDFSVFGGGDKLVSGYHLVYALLIYLVFTPGSMNSMFSDFFREFRRVILGVFGTI